MMRIYQMRVIVFILFLSFSQPSYAKRAWEDFPPTTKEECDQKYPKEKEDTLAKLKLEKFIQSAFFCYIGANELDLAESYAIEAANKNSLYWIMMLGFFYSTKRGELERRTTNFKIHSLEEFDKFIFWQKKAVDIIIEPDNFEYYIKNGKKFDEEHRYYFSAFDEIIASLIYKYLFFADVIKVENGMPILEELLKYADICLEAEKLPFWPEEKHEFLLNMCTRAKNLVEGTLPMERERFSIGKSCWRAKDPRPRSEACFEEHSSLLDKIYNFQEKFF